MLRTHPAAWPQYTHTLQLPCSQLQGGELEAGSEGDRREPLTGPPACNTGASAVLAFDPSQTNTAGAAGSGAHQRLQQVPASGTLCWVATTSP